MAKGKDAQVKVISECVRTSVNKESTGNGDVQIITKNNHTISLVDWN